MGARSDQFHMRFYNALRIGTMFPSITNPEIIFGNLTNIYNNSENSNSTLLFKHSTAEKHTTGIVYMQCQEHVCHSLQCLIKCKMMFRFSVLVTSINSLVRRKPRTTRFCLSNA